ncbi:MAG: hypothetical protein UY48_C0038G0021 [Candidatus Gottesmanbacteria bacterium GW2011_GWB1_49_7]|uniref:Uncharacterized protein n=1 Tax=Candidatus Gottesmanbacteria bacterium GW2011_GWB1_49_7 TaxID=1618448 RepID=A0A0G1VVC9_9BACT|nr:MAG: hypothetical protein UY48_C0038G0021 [Candidatus Gottesmanbacteria bacterium GW2011_GWB1_49_7]
MEPVEELEVQEFTIEEVEAVLSTDRDGDEVLDTLTRGEMKLAIRTGQFNEAELKAIEEASIFSAREIQILLSHPTALDTPPVSEHKSEKRKKIKKESSSTQLTSQIQQALVASKVGLTIDEICVAIGVLPEDFDPGFWSSFHFEEVPCIDS